MVAATLLLPSAASAQTSGSHIDSTIVVPGLRNFLEPNAPNPVVGAGASTRIAYTISEEGPVRIRVYDFFYNPVVTLINDVQTAGRHTVVFNILASMPSGVYFYELRTNQFHQIRRMIFIK